MAMGQVELLDNSHSKETEAKSHGILRLFQFIWQEQIKIITKKDTDNEEEKCHSINSTTFTVGSPMF